MTLNNILAFCVTFIISVILTPFIGKITKEMGILIIELYIMVLFLVQVDMPPMWHSL